MYSLTLYGRATGSSAYWGNITALARNWQRSTRARGGYWLGSFMITSERMARHELVNFFENALGRVLQETSAGGIVTWEGLVQEMRLLMGGVEYMVSLRPEWWHNNVKVIYRSIVDGSRQTVAWSELTESSDEYGEMQMFLSLPATTSAAATAFQAAHLTEYGWPRSRMVGSIAFPGRATQEDVLYVKCAGYWHTLNWLYRETSITDTASNIITTLAGDAEFVTASRIEDNTLSTYIECTPNPRRLGDAIDEIVSQGDASGNLWQCGVYVTGKLVYEQAPQEVDYLIRPQALCDKFGAPVHAPLVEPGILVYNANAPLSVARPGGSAVWDDPRIGYVEQVEFIAPDGLRLRLYDEEETIAVLGEQIAAEIAIQKG